MADFAKHDTSHDSADAAPIPSSVEGGGQGVGEARTTGHVASADERSTHPLTPSLSGRGNAPAPVTHVNLERCRLSLIKGEHRWRFRWERGSEAALISAVADLARDPQCEFDWFDAAIVCRQIAHNTPPAKAATSAHPAHKPPHLPAQISRAPEK
jgi:hypothetical protein